MKIEATPEEIAALVVALQERRNSSNSPDGIIREVVRQAIGDRLKASSDS